MERGIKLKELVAGETRNAGECLLLAELRRRWAER
jgi:hypothetical protein